MKRIDRSGTAVGRFGGLFFCAVAIIVLPSAGCGTAQYNERMDQRMRELRQISQPEETQPAADRGANSPEEE
jgi:hypothetical protein